MYTVIVIQDTSAISFVFSKLLDSKHNSILLLGNW